MENILCLGYINVGGLGTSVEHSEDEFLRHYIQQKQFNIFGTGEVNNHWRKLSCANQLEERMSGWWETSHCHSAYNRTDTASA